MSADQLMAFLSIGCLLLLGLAYLVKRGNIELFKWRIKSGRIAITPALAPFLQSLPDHDKQDLLGWLDRRSDVAPQAPLVSQTTDAQPTPVAPVVSITSVAAVTTPDLAAGAVRVALSAIADADNLAIVGPKGSRKTTLLRTLLSRRSGEQIAFDPHNAPGKWPSAVVGGGNDFLAISETFQRAHEALNERARQLNAGTAREGTFPRRTLLSDEFWAINYELGILAKQRKDPKIEIRHLIASRLSQGRKFNECTLVVSHTDTLSGLGLPDGAADMKACFDFVVYCGALAIDRCGDPAVRAAALAMDVPMVVYASERDRWTVLTIDLPPVTSEMRFATQVQHHTLERPAPVAPDSDELLRRVLAELPPEREAIEAESAPAEAGTVTVAEAELNGDEIARVAQITAMILAGKSKSEIARLVPRSSGRNYDAFSRRYEQIKAAIEAIPAT